MDDDCFDESKTGLSFRSKREIFQVHRNFTMARQVKCPICRTEVEWENNPHRPFCSERCRLIDLGSWIEERYRIPGGKPESTPRNRDNDSE